MKFGWLDRVLDVVRGEKNTDIGMDNLKNLLSVF